MRRKEELVWLAAKMKISQIWRFCFHFFFVWENVKIGLFDLMPCSVLTLFGRFLCDYQIQLRLVEFVFCLLLYPFMFSIYPSHIWYASLGVVVTVSVILMNLNDTRFNEFLYFRCYFRILQVAVIARMKQKKNNKQIMRFNVNELI